MKNDESEDIDMECQDEPHSGNNRMEVQTPASVGVSHRQRQKCKAGKGADKGHSNLDNVIRFKDREY